MSDSPKLVRIRLVAAVPREIAEGVQAAITEAVTPFGAIPLVTEVREGDIDITMHFPRPDQVKQES